MTVPEDVTVATFIGTGELELVLEPDELWFTKAVGEEASEMEEPEPGRHGDVGW